MGGLGAERAGAEPRVLWVRTARPPLPPPGPRRPGFAHSAAGKCYFAGKVSAGTARIPAAAPGPLGLVFFASPSASRGVRRPLGRGSAPGAAPSAPRPWVSGAPQPARAVGAGGSSAAETVPAASRPPRGPRLLVRPRAQSRAPSRRVEAVARHTGRRGPREERGALGLRSREQRRDGTQPDGQAAAAHRPLRVPTWPRAGPPPVSARRAAAGRPWSSLAQPPGASQRLRPAEWRALLAAGAAEGRQEAGSARISINSGPRRSPPPAPSLPPAPRPGSELTPEGPPASRRLRMEQPWGGRGAGCCALGGPPKHPIHCRCPRALARSRARPLGPAWARGFPGHCVSCPPSRHIGLNSQCPPGDCGPGLPS